MMDQFTQKITKATGEYFGYPECCIKAYIENNGQLSHEQIKAFNQKGFTPCHEHSVQINEGKVKAEELILPTRLNPGAYPNEIIQDFINWRNQWIKEHP